MKLQLLDADYDMVNNNPVIRLYCKDSDGNTKCVFYEKFLPYFYVLPKDKEKTKQNLRDDYEGEIKKIEEEKKYLPNGYTENKSNVLKITNTNPSMVPKIRQYLEERGLIEEAYEADILFKYRFMADMGLKGMGWIEVEGNHVKTDTVKAPVIKADKIKPLDIMEHAPLRYLAFDIECLQQENDRPVDMEKDPIIMISISFHPKYNGDSDLVLVAKPGRNHGTLHFSDEKEMLKKFLDIIGLYDPDMLIGYNIENFDLPYIVKRLEVLGMDRKFGRNQKTVFSRSIGQFTRTDVSGRAVIDPYMILKNNPVIRLKRYNLDTVAKDLLGEEKVDVNFEEMEKLWKSNGKGLTKFIEYCRKDSDLVMKLVTKKGIIDEYFELSRLSGVLLKDSMGGQTTKIDNRLLREFNQQDVLLPCKPSGETIKQRKKQREREGLKGGLVLEPEKGLHTDGCVDVLDFKSLYPSIMRTFNICPTTLLLDDKKLRKDGRRRSVPQTHDSPTGGKFVKQEIKQGIVPQILGDLVDTRTEVKKQMNKEEDKNKKQVLKAKQLAIKIFANAMYGYMGFVGTRIYRTEMANSITSFGRYIIEKTKELVEKNFNLKVVYGDTDSVMIKANTKNLDEAKKIGDEVSGFISKELPGYLELEFEKCFRSFLILTKKRYAAWQFEKKGEEWKDKIGMKGIETVRRDWCSLVERTMNKVIKKILKQGDIKNSIRHVQSVVKEVYEGKCSLDDLAVVKGVTKRVEDYDGVLPHIELAKKINRRNPSKKITPGNRLPFVIIKGNQMLSKRAEHPDYVRERGYEIDSDYYVNYQLLPPLERIFSSIGVQRNELIGKGRQFNLLETVNNKSSVKNRDVSIDQNPKTKVIKTLDNFVCNDCKRNFNAPPLTGRCECGGEIFASGAGNIGKYIAIEK